MAYARLRPFLAAGAVLLAAVVSLVAYSGAVLAEPNEVSVEPAGVEVAPGGSATVQLIADPPATTLTIWAIDVLFDPDVVTTTGRDCDTLDPPPDSTTIGACFLEDGVDDTVVVLGALIFNDDGSGLAGRTVLADITFTAVGEPGQCSDLRLLVRLHTDADAEETNPLLSDGQICVEQDAPPIGTAVPRTPEPRTSEPTPPGGGPTLPPLESDGDETPANGAQTRSDGSESASPADTGDTASRTSSPAVSGEDNGGDGALFWALLGLGILIAAGGVAWGVVRTRSRAGGSADDPSA